MEKNIKIQAPCKLNLSLNITGIRHDGYHLMEMIMQSVNLSDYITISITYDSNISLKSNDTHIPWNKTNIAYKAVELFYINSGIVFTGVDIYVEKNIPYQAGLAGGSGNGGGVLYGLNVLYGYPLSMEKLLEIALELGADVPFSIIGGTKLATGIGEVLSILPPLPSCYIVIAKPKMGVSTQRCFKEYDTKITKYFPHTQKIISALGKGDLSTIASNMCNVFEEHCGLPLVYEYKNQILAHGALGAMMTGTGSAVFGIFSSKKKAELCYNSFVSITDEVYITKPIPHGSLIIF